jgi:hypothetical protein
LNDAEIDQALGRAARASDAVSSAVLERITAAIEKDLSPVRPLPAAWTLAAALILIASAVALLGAARAGFFGFLALTPLSRGVVFVTLAILVGVTGRQTVNPWIPGSRSLLSPLMLLVAISIALLAVFSLQFDDYHTERFWSQGVRCLGTGLCHTLLVFGLGWWWMRRGYAVNPAAAGLLLGLLGGLGGVAMLELHCPNLEAAHVLVWHTLVVPMSGLAGALAGALLRRRFPEPVSRSRG